MKNYKSIYQMILASSIILSTIVGCKKSEIPVFNDDYASVRFPLSTNDNKEPSGYNDIDKIFVVSYSFVSNPQSTSSDVDIPVMVVGPSSNEERTIKVDVLEDETTASAEDYKIISATIPAQKNQGQIRIKLINSDRLKNNDLKIKLRLGTNDYFASTIKDLNEAVVYFGTKVPTPTHPEHIYTYNRLIDGDPNPYSNSLDYYSPAAMMVIVQALKWTDWDEKSKHGGDFNGEKYGKYKYLPRYGYISKNNHDSAFVKIIDEYITAYNTSHPGAPLVHDDGKLKGQPIKARL